ncbi:hypothetical protein [Streptomyces sp. NPDC059455]|uniref:hypothetical protein n=1 Tax=Streptomyces sp. NPDC059455 TaxID=3346837 RepID=UPI0036BD7696
MFSLAAVLVYAATGRDPFSHAEEQIPAAALMYRVVHEEPDLEGVAPELVPLLTACLAKDPAARPTAAQLSGWLEDRGGRIGRWLEECPRVLAGKLTETEHSAGTLVDLAHPPVAAPAGQESVPRAMRSDTVPAVLAEPGRGRRLPGCCPPPSRRSRPRWRWWSPSTSVRSVPRPIPPRPRRAAASAQEPQEPQEPQEKDAPLKVIKATFELATGESVVAGTRSLIMQEDGSLVVHDQDHKPRWAAMTKGEGNSARFQADRNLVVYNSEGQHLWSSRTNGHPGAVLVFQADGNGVIKSGDAVLWAVGTKS